MEKLYIATEGEFLSLVRTAVREELALLAPVRAESGRLPSGTRHESNAPPASRQITADHLGISKPTLDNLIKTGQLPAFKIGKQIRIRWLDIESFLNKKGAIK